MGRNKFKIYCLSTLIFFSSLAFGQVNIIEGKYPRNVNAETNYIKNKSCFENVAGITASGGSLTRSTATPVEKGTSCQIDASASGQTYTWAMQAMDPALKNQNCEAKFFYKGDASLYKAYVNIGATKVTTDLQLENQTDGRNVSINFPCGDLSSLTTLVIESTSASAAVINVGKAYGGGITNLGFADVDTDWASYTATFGTGFGTVTTQNLEWRRVGDSIQIRGQFYSGTPAASTASFSLPNSLTARVSIGGGQDFVAGTWVNNDGTVSKHKSGHLLVPDGSNVIYFGVGEYTTTDSGQIHQKGTAVATSATQVMWVNVVGLRITGWTSESAVSVSANTLPTVQRFLSGSGTYTKPPGVSYIRVKLVGGGGGGGGSGTGSPTAGGTGGTTTFGTSLLTANGGQGGDPSTSAGGGGGGGSTTVSSPAISVASLNGGIGGSGSNNLAVVPGGMGSASPFGGAGGGGRAHSGGGGSGGNNAASNTGSGGGGAGSANASENAAGGGGAGGFIDAIIINPSSSYSYSVGAAGSAGSAGTGGAGGGAGGSGIVIVEEYYHQSNVPILVGSVTSQTPGTERIERAFSSSTGTIGSQSGSWLSLSSKVTGVYTWNIASGVFSGAPVCICNPSGNSAGNCVVDSNATTGFRTLLRDSATVLTDTNHEIICMGQR